MTDDPALRLYAEHAGALAARWQAAYGPDEVLAPIADLLPTRPGRAADIGAGPGREAAWLASLGHRVTAVEPVAEFRAMAQGQMLTLGQAQAGASPVAPSVTWLDDRLPDLALLRQSPPFDLLLLSGVWHHVAPEIRARAMAALGALLAAEGRLVISLRLGPVDPVRGLYGVDAGETAALADACGLRLLAQRATGAIQQHNRDAGVSWIWQVFTKPA